MLNLLYVEDNPEIRLVMSELLNKRLGIPVEVAVSGNQAIARLAAGDRFSIIVSDYSMPDGNGADLRRYIVEQNIECLFAFFTAGSAEAWAAAAPLDHRFLGVVRKTDIGELCGRITEGLLSFQLQSV